MFAQLYTLLLVVITTAAISIPQMESDYPTLKPITISQLEFHHPTLNRRFLVPPGFPQCTDPHYPLLQTSFCKTMTSIRAVCESNVFPGSYTTSDVNCPQDSTCVDFTTRSSIPYALCVPNELIRKWNNGHEKTKVCSEHFTINIGKNTMTIGMTTFSTGGNPIQVDYMNANIGDHNIGGVFSKHNFSMIYNNYKKDQIVNMCFRTGTDQTAIGVCAFIDGNY